MAGLDEEAGAGAVGDALRAGVLHDWGEDRYGFRHGLAQQAVYEALLTRAGGEPINGSAY